MYRVTAFSIVGPHELDVTFEDGPATESIRTATPAALWRQPLAGGAPTRLLDGVINLAFDVIAGGIYYLDRATPAEQRPSTSRAPRACSITTLRRGGRR